MSFGVETSPLTKDHETAEFDCGKQALNEFLTRFALMNSTNGSTRTYVVVEGARVIGYYSLAMGSVGYASVPGRVTKGLARHDVPVVLMARFTVDQREQGRGLGRALFFDALARSLRGSKAIAARAFFVRAKDAETRAFYERFGTISSHEDPLDLFLLLKDVRATLDL